MRVTTKDLARICGVSRATVTRALYNTGSVKKETRELILKTAEALGYQPDMIARSLVKGKSMMISVVVAELRNQYFAKVIDSIERKAKEYGYMLTISLHEDDRDYEKKIIHELAGYRIDGFILLCINKGEDIEEALRKTNIPYVILGYKTFMNSSTVGADEYKIGCMATQYMYQKNYNEMVFVVPPLYDRYQTLSPGHASRKKGFEETAESLNVKHTVIYGHDNYIEQVIDYMKTKRESKPAFFCSGDIYAVEIINALSQHGYKVKKDYGIIGCDKIDSYQKLRPRLTTIDSNIELMGQEAVTLLFEKIVNADNIPKRDIEIPISIVEGETL